MVITGGKGRLGSSWTDYLRGLGAEVTVWDLPEIDVSDLNSVQQASKGLELDGLINAAAIDNPPESETAGFSEVLNVNVTGMYNVCQTLIPKMRGGAVVNIASIYGLVSPFWEKNMAYGASKAAVIQMTKHFAVFNPHVRVNSVSFGGVEANQPEWFMDEYKARCPLMRMARIHEYDDVIKFMLTTTYMTGSNLVVDGGWTAL